MKYIGYIRVSTLDQARTGVSLADQEEKIRQYVALADGELVDVIQDGGRSGKDLDREGVQEAFSRVLNGEADVLVVYAIDRLSRSALDLLQLVSKLRDGKRGFASVREQMDSTTPHGRFTMTILAAVAEMEREMIRSRCRDASARCVRDGRVWGKVPFGYQRDRGGKRLIEDPVEMAVLQGILALRDAGYSYAKIAAHLNRRGRGPKIGARWYPSSVRSVVLTHQKYREVRSLREG